MNQKQRDYLIKRLQKLAEEKKASFRLDPPDISRFIGELKLIKEPALLALINRKLLLKEDMNGWGDKAQVIGIKNDYGQIYVGDVYSNYKEVNAKCKEFCKKHYDVYDKRLISIDKECQIHCDKIVFAESYEEALAILGEFTKF